MNAVTAYDLQISYRDKVNDRRSLSSKTRVYVWPEGESILTALYSDNFWNRRSRPIDEYRKVLRQAFAQEGIDVSKLDYRWSQKAGCSCGCSPGFVVDGYDPKLKRKDVHITVKG